MPNIRTIIKKFIPKPVFKRIEPFGHLIEAMAVNVTHGFPAKKMRIIGITGTNGKTTTAFMVHKMLTEAGYDVGLMTTVAYGMGSDITPQVAHMTTASAPLLQKRLREFYEAGAEWVVLETTSHALAQHRVWGIPYEIVAMTNVTHEHLDYHGTFTQYFEAKLKLFKIAARNQRGFGIVNADDPKADLFTGAIENSITYGIKSGQLRATDIELQSDGSRYKVKIDDEAYTIRCRIPGEFNVYNSLVAVAIGRHMGLSREQIEWGISALLGVEGRMTVIDEGQPFSVVIDFAHTPDSFERLLRDVRISTKGKLIVLFGSAGRRDEEKRAIQGEIAGRYADEVVLTEEDDRDVDGTFILNQIAAGAEEAGKVRDKNLFLLLDRVDAIDFAVSRAKDAKDTVILLGKGHEKTIERADGEHPWNEMDVTRQALKKRQAHA